MDELKQTIRTAEKDISLGSAALFLLLSLFYFVIGYNGYFIFIGYLIGNLGFVASCECFFLFRKYTYMKFFIVMFMNLKLALIALAVYFIYKSGYSVIQSVSGIFLSQIAVTAVFIYLRKLI